MQRMRGKKGIKIFLLWEAPAQNVTIRPKPPPLTPPEGWGEAERAGVWLHLLCVCACVCVCVGESPSASPPPSSPSPPATGRTNRR